MNLGIFPHRGGSLENWRTVGQDKRVVNYYLNEYAKAFDKVYFFSYADSGEKRSDLADNVIIVPNSHGIPFFIYGLIIPLMHRRLIKKCDLFRVFHISGTPAAVLARIIYGKPYVTTYGYMWLRDIKFHNKRLQVPIARIVEWFGLKLADRVIITVDETRKYVSGFVNQERITEIPNGVDTTVFRRLKEKKGKRFTVISAGRLCKIKNYDSLVKAVAKIDDSELVLYGDGPEAESLKSLAETTGCKLSLPGMISNEKLAKEFSRADIFVLPSHSEGMPKALIEAMSCEIPCIVSDIPTLREIAGNGSRVLLCERTPEGIYEKLLFVRDHPTEASEMAKTARSYIVSNLSTDKLIRKEIKLLKELWDNQI